MKFKTILQNILLESINLLDFREDRSLPFFAVLTEKGELVLVPTNDNSQEFSIDFKIGEKISSTSHLEKDWYFKSKLLAILYVDIKNKIINPSTEFNYFKFNDLNSKGEKIQKREKGHLHFNPKMLEKLKNDLIVRKLIPNNLKFSDDNLPITNEDGNLYFYHGTNRKSAVNIMKVGLRPMDTKNIMVTNRFSDDMKTKSMFRGNSSTIQGYTDNNIYLTPSINVAKSYAWRQTTFKEDPEDSPIVLKVMIPDPSKLLIDDDVMSRLLINSLTDWLDKNSEEVVPYDYIKGYSLFKTKWSGDKLIPYFTQYVYSLVLKNLEDIVKNNKINNFHDLRNGYINFKSDIYVKAVEDLGNEFLEELKEYVRKEYNIVKNTYWKKSAYIHNVDAVAYNGPILPKFITEVPIKYDLKQIRNT
jgi:hypothetical protein